MIRRLEQFIKNQGLSVRSFEQSIGASDGMIRRAIKNNTDIQSKWLSITADIYPNLDINWLLTGRGFMLKSESTSPRASMFQTHFHCQQKNLYYIQCTKKKRLKTKN